MEEDSDYMIAKEKSLHSIAISLKRIADNLDKMTKVPYIEDLTEEDRTAISENLDYMFKNK